VPARARAPAGRIVLSHGQALLAKHGGTAIVTADFAEPAAILDAPNGRPQARRDSGAVQRLTTAPATGKFEDPYNAPSAERDERVRIDQAFAMIASLGAVPNRYARLGRGEWPP
jgi:hypothetical protein